MRPHVSEILIYNPSSRLSEMIISKNISRKKCNRIFFFMNRPPEPLYPTIKIRHPDAEFLIEFPKEVMLYMSHDEDESMVFR